jgi:hypothetical protein
MKSTKMQPLNFKIDHDSHPSCNLLYEKEGTPITIHVYSNNLRNVQICECKFTQKQCERAPLQNEWSCIDAKTKKIHIDS